MFAPVIPNAARDKHFFDIMNVLFEIPHFVRDVRSIIMRSACPSLRSGRQGGDIAVVRCWDVTSQLFDLFWNSDSILN